MADETTPEKCENLYNKLNTFVESEISRDVTPQISNLNSRINALEPNLVRVKEVNGNTSSISAGGTSTQTFTVPACPSGYSWKYLSTSTGWGTVSSVSLSGTTLTVTLLNVSNSSHDISFSGVLMYYPNTMEAEPHITMTATNPYLLEGEVTDLVVSLVDEFGLPLNNKNITIGQSVFIDDGTTANYNDHWYIDSYGTATVQDNGTKLLNTSGDINFTMRSIVPSDKTLTLTNSYSYSPPYTIEFDIVETDGTSSNNAQVQIYSDESKGNFAQTLTTGHYKIEVTSEEQKIWVDDTLIKTTNLSLPNARITLRVRYGKYLIYKNFVVYEIINGVTDENGEFGLYDISDDTIFTATYGTETATTDVYLCQVVDYGVTGKSRLNYWYWNSNFGSGSVDDNGTIFTANSTSNYLTVSALTTEIYDNMNIYIYDFPFTVEFDIVSFNDPSNSNAMSRIRIYNITDKHIAYWDLKDYGIGHYKIVCTEGSQKLYFNGVEQSRKFTFTTNDGHWDCSFQTYGNIKFKNFRIR